MSDHRRLIDRAWEIMQSKRLDQLGDVLAADCEFGMSNGFRTRGIAGFRSMLETWLTAFPDLRHEVRETVEQGETIAVRLFVRGTHTGPFHGPEGTIPATGREVVWDSVDWVKIANGKIASWSVYEDGMAFLAQLGVLPAKRAG
jgi:steroid delta-isomerase-like uncharacterized protein